MSDIKVQIDRDECISCGACYADCPDVFEENPDDGLSQIVEAFRTGGDPGQGMITESLRDCATSAAEGCPVEVIHVG
jgi:ferredoxin